MTLRATAYFWGTDITRMPASWKQCVTMFTEEMPWLKGRDLELVMGRACAMPRLEIAGSVGASVCHPRESGGPGQPVDQLPSIPAFAGMTVQFNATTLYRIGRSAAASRRIQAAGSKRARQRV